MSQRYPAGVNELQKVAPRERIIIDNDFGGDPDGLFQLAHHLLSPSVEVRGIIGSPNYPGGFCGLSPATEFACELARQTVELICPEKDIPIIAAAAEGLKDATTPRSSAASALIVREAMREDAKLPLTIACGAGLTSLASALLENPEINERLKLVWIGGPEYEGLALPPPGGKPLEYNLGIDVRAAQVVFNHSNIPIWQVPRDAYRQVLVSYAELRTRVKNQGEVGKFLIERLETALGGAKKSLGETYVLGDNPLVLLTALQSTWEVDPSSSEYVLMPRPIIRDDGTYQPNPTGASIRVYRRLDTRLLLADFFAKLALLA